MRSQAWLMLVLAALMIGGCGDTSEADNVVDDFYAALETTDPDAAAAQFAHEGVFIDKNGDEWIGRSEIASFVEMAGPGITRCERTGAAETAEDGTFVFPMQFTFAGDEYRGEVALTLGDGLIVRHDWKTRP